MTINKISQQDEFDAKTNRYSSRVVILLELQSGNIAVFNNARELTGVVVCREGRPETYQEMTLADDVSKVFQYIKNNLWREPRVVFKAHETEAETMTKPLNLDITKYGDDDC